MSIADKLTQIAENQQRVYDTGYEKGKSLINCLVNLNGSFSGVTFPENTELSLHLKWCNAIGDTFRATKNLKSIKITVDVEGTQNPSSHTFRETSAEIIDLTDSKFLFQSLVYTFYYSTSLKSILGELDLSKCTTTNAAFTGCNSLEDIRIKKDTILVSINLNTSTKLTKASLTSIINGLNSEVTGQTLNLSKTAVNNAFETSAGAADGSDSEEWATLIATKINWTISLT